MGFNHVSAAPRASRSLVLLYTLCLLPLSIDGFGVNYLFALIPAGVLICGNRLIRPREGVVLFICACSASFAVSSAYQINWIEFFDRRMISFVLLMTMFSMCFVRITDKHIESFKVAVIIAAAYFSLQSLAMFLSLGVAAQAFESKDVVGSQRYGFVYILAFWIIWYDKILITSRLLKGVILLVLVLGIALTFSRASIVAFSASIVVSVAYFISSVRLLSLRFAKYLATAFVFVSLGIYVVYMVAPIVFDFFFVRLIDYIASGSSADALADSETSDGTRVFIWTHIIEFVLHNPLTGAGFLGVWILNLFEGFSGSSHSQYFDALFRLGPLLFLGYMYFIFKILRYFRSSDFGIFVGLIGILVYGLFHETFKESHGMFILAMLIASSMTRGRLSNGRFNFKIVK
jgi:O-antigen ligase